MAIFMLMVLTFASSANAVPFQTTGHTDIRFTYEGGTPDILYYLDQGSTVGGQSISVSNPMGGTPVGTKIAFQPSQLVTFVPDPPIARPASGAGIYSWEFTGAAVGEPLWYIPMSQDPIKPWTGISTEAVSSATFSAIRYQLTAFNGPGDMSLTTTGVFGGNTVYFQTSNGLSGDDKIDTTAGQHIHYNWFFTEPGTYAFDLTAIGTFGGGTVSVTDTFTFQVSVPEPGSALLAIAGVLGTAAIARRRKY